MHRFHSFSTVVCLGLSVLSVPWATSSPAQVTTTITGSGLNTSVQHTPGSTTWNIRGGTPSAGQSNLFHSFGDFSIGRDHTAAFQNLQADGVTPVVTNAAGVSNIIGRVTGGNPSNLFGTLNSSSGFPNANLFLINPAGIIFGPGAALNVGGAVRFSTADYLRLGTGNEFFYADLAKSSTLSSAPVTAFGFLGASPSATRAIELTSSTNLAMAQGQHVALVGRDMTNGSAPVPGVQLDQARITSPGGQISLVSVGTPRNPESGGEVSAENFSPAPASSEHGFATMGAIHMANSSFLSVGDSSGTVAGQIVIRGGQLSMEQGSRLLAGTTDVNEVSGKIDIQVTGAMTLSGDQTVIDTSASGSARVPAGDVVIRAGSLTVTDGAQIRATNFSKDAAQPRGGNIDITADTVLVSGVFHHPDSGTLTRSGLFSEAKDGVKSGGGQIRVTANELSVLDGATIATTTEGLGPAGDIVLTAPHILVSGVNSGCCRTSVSTRSAVNPDISSPQSGGEGGTIHIRTTHLDIRDGGQLNASTDTAGSAGSVEVIADTITIAGAQGILRSGISTESLPSGSIAGDGGNVSLTTSSLSISDRGAIVLETNGGGSGGHFTVEAANISITSGGLISSGSLGNGTAGSLSLSSEAFSMTGAGSGLSIRTLGPGNGGTISVAAQNALLGPGTSIDSRTGSSFVRAEPTMQAAGGNVNLSIGNTLMLQGGLITASSSGIGKAGTIQITATETQLTHGGAINAVTSGSGSAGNIIVNGRTVTVSGAASAIDSSTTGIGNAGNILIQAGHVDLEQGGTISSASTAPATGNAGSITVNASNQFHSTGGNVSTSADRGRGGDIAIQSGEIVLENGAIASASTKGLQDAGNILLIAGDRIMLNDSAVTTSASKASGGNITLQAPNLIRLRTGQIVSSVQGGPETSGGDITIDPQAVLLQNNSQILARAFEGLGGNIALTAGILIVDGTSVIDASSQLGISGQVSLQAPLRNVAGVITPLPQAFASPANLYGQRCAAQKGGEFSSFVQGTRDGLPVQPGDLIPSPLFPETLALSSMEVPGEFNARGLGPELGHDSSKSLLLAGCRF